MKTPLLLGGLLMAVAACLLTSPVSAAVSSDPRQTYDAAFTAEQPATSTGLRQSIRYLNPHDAEGKPPAVEEVVIRLPEGSRIDTTVPTECKANDVQLQLQGAGACPIKSRVGSGTLSADTGIEAVVFPRVVETQLTFLNNRNQLILLAESTNTPGPPIRSVSRIEIRDATFISRVPPLPGAPPPDPFLALREALTDLQAIQRAAYSGGWLYYLRTPSTCPASGFWTFSATFTYRDGVTQTEVSHSPCSA